MIDANELLRWYEREQRDLPWRRCGVTPWQVLVSEFMLQQTPVARVEPSGWIGWRAGQPHPRPRRPPRRTCCARGASSATHGGRSGCTSARWSSPPSTATKYPPTSKPCCRFLESAPTPQGPSHASPTGSGCLSSTRTCAAWWPGPYTGEPTRRRRPSPRDLDDVAALLPNDDDAPRFSIALMELGATVCTARAPRCGLCPLSACAWRSGGYQAAHRTGTPGSAVRGHRPSSPRTPAGCVAWQRLPRHPGTTRPGLADRHGPTRPRAWIPSSSTGSSSRRPTAVLRLPARAVKSLAKRPVRTAGQAARASTA